MTGQRRPGRSGRCTRAHRQRQLVALATLALLAPFSARAQTDTTGAAAGVVRSAQAEPVAGATVVATSPALPGFQSDVTGATGGFYLNNLAPGTYQITVYYGQMKWSRGDVLVQLGKVTRVNFSLDTEATAGETVVIEGRPPVIDQGSAKTGVTITGAFSQRIPTGRSFQETATVAPGAQADTFGTAFSGATSPENLYVVEGLNVTDPIHGGSTALFQGANTTTNLPSEFTEEMEVTTGGYGAEYGRATGAVINVITKAGGNRYAGSVFTYLTPGALSPRARAIDREGSAIARQDNLSYELSTGAELGGPIVRDRAWFHVGFNPVLQSTAVVRSINSFVDEDGDGALDRDPATGFARVREVSSHTFHRSRQSYLFTGKLTLSPRPNHRGSLSLFGSPGAQNTFRRVTGREESGRLDVADGAWDLVGKWSSTFNDNRTEIELAAGTHRNRFRESPVDGGEGPQVVVDEAQLSDLAVHEPGGAIPEQCQDGSASDPYPLIDNCPVTDYNTGGLGFIETLNSSRLVASAKVSQRLRAAGRHRLRAGIDVERIDFARQSAYTGGQRFDYSPLRFGDVLAQGFFAPDASGTISCDGVGGNQSCTYLPGGVAADTSSLLLSSFLENSWSPIPELTLTAGLRWERQRVSTADQLTGRTSAASGELIDDEAFTLDHLWSPRFTAIYDWTGEGRSRVYGHWGRYYQAVPQFVASRAFGGEVSGRYFYALDECKDWRTPSVEMCPEFAEAGEGVSRSFLGGDEQLVVPDLDGQYLDQLIAGVEYELLPDLALGAAYIRNDLGRIIEDVSADGGRSTILANPGEPVDPSAIERVRAEAEAARSAGDLERADFLDGKADSLAIVGEFDRPRRLYQALQLTATRRFSANFMAQASYTLSRTEGNVAGMIQPEKGINGLTPNYGSLYDLQDMMANQYGKLPQDRPHMWKLFGHYTHPVPGIGQFGFGLGLRAQSGMPVSARARHSIRGAGQTLLLQQGSMDRTSFLTQLDTKLSYRRDFADGMALEAFLDLFNLLNTKTETEVDEIYTFDIAAPIVDGDEEDLTHAKALDRNGVADGRTIEKNPNHGRATAAQAPLQARFGLRLLF
jgi:outer membrane receptor protein involved in Fe transport